MVTSTIMKHTFSKPSTGSALSGITPLKRLPGIWSCNGRFNGPPKKELPELAGVVRTPTRTLHAITGGKPVHPHTFCVGDGGSTTCPFPGGIDELLYGCRCVHAATTLLSPVGCDLSSSVSPLPLLRAPPCGGLLPATLVRRPE